MELNERIKSLRIRSNMTQKDLGERIDVSTVSIGNWEAGIKKPSMQAIVALSRVFNVTADYLLGIKTKSTEDVIPLTKGEKILLSDYRVLDTYGKKAVDSICSIEKKRIETELVKLTTITNVSSVQKLPSRYIPRYTTPSAAGYSVSLDGDDFDMILVDESVPYDADFAVRIQGSSMYPHIHDGDTVYVKRDCELSIGDVGIFSVDGAMYCKQYYIDDERNLTLVSANPDCKDSNVYVGIDGGADVRCCGKVLLKHRIELPDYIFE